MPAMPRTLTAALHQEEDWFIAQCLEVDVASQGHTIDEALANLAEAVELYLEEVDDPAGHITATPLVTSFQLPAASAQATLREAARNLAKDERFKEALKSGSRTVVDVLKRHKWL
jgi:predicted RNase H-like HicB family nuclease